MTRTKVALLALAVPAVLAVGGGSVVAFAVSPAGQSGTAGSPKVENVAETGAAGEAPEAPEATGAADPAEPGVVGSGHADPEGAQTDHQFDGAE